jgi:hypothetical protein
MGNLYAHRDTTLHVCRYLILAWGCSATGCRSSPVARDVLTENMSDAMFVLDVHSRLVDLNLAAQPSWDSRVLP